MNPFTALSSPGASRPVLRRRPRRVVVALALAGLAACQQAGPPPPPAAITRDTACSLDGMTVDDFPGPKAQIVYAEGAPDFFCDTIELFSVLLKPEQQRTVAAVYVQDMAKADWNHPVGQWIDARKAWYVVGSKAHGSMGATFASFAKEADARAFAARQGGQAYPFDKITPDMAVLDGGVMKDRGM